MGVLQTIASALTNAVTAGVEVFAATADGGKEPEAGFMDEACPECQGAVSRNWRLCPHCGSIIVDDRS